MLNLTEKEWQSLTQSRLMQGIEIEELQHLLICLDARKVTFDSGETIKRYEGQETDDVGILLKGQANISRYDYWGRRHIVAVLQPTDLFGESYAARSAKGLAIEVQAVAETTVLFLRLQHIITMCPSACSYHARLIANLVELLAAKNRALNEKLMLVTQPSLREKILSYLSEEAQRQEAAYFDILLNRQELADYLNADRSALSGELSRMKQDGLIDYQKNHFRLLV